MDLSSSATQRSASSEGLTIQPGSVRSPAADAANEFARHLAENARTESRQRRDDRPADRDDRRAERSRSTREDETETRKAARKENDTEEPRTDETDETDKTASAEQQVVQTAAETESPEETSGAEPAAEETAEAQTGANTNETRDETATDKAENDTAEMVAAAAAAPVTPEAADGSVAQPRIAAMVEPSRTAAASADTAGTATSSNNTAPAGATSPQAPVAPAAVTADGSKTKAENTGAHLPGVQAAPTSGDEAPDIIAEELKLVEKTKPTKGLGQEAAEQLANRKADGKQAAEQPKATPQVQAATTQAQRATVQPAAPLASPPADTSAASRGGELPVSTTQQAATNGSTATVRIGTLPGQSQPTQVPAAAIALQMARNLQKGMSRFDIRLDPPEMGRVDVRMEVRKDGHVVAHMSVERPETLDLLQRDARALQQALNNAGLQADSDSLNFTLKDQNEGTGDRDFANRSGGQGGAGGSEDDVPLSPVYNVNLSTNGGIDIRI